VKASLLIKGVTIDCLKLDGKTPVDNGRLAILAIVGARTRTGRHFFSKEVGSGWRSHCLFGRQLIA